MRDFGPFLLDYQLYQDPDVVYAISQKGVHKSNNLVGHGKQLKLLMIGGF